MTFHDIWTSQRLEELCRDLGIESAKALGLLQAGGYLRGSLPGLVHGSPEIFLRRWAGFPENQRQIEILSGVLEYEPDLELTKYLCIHNTIDIFCWLLKFRYATGPEMKKKQYTLPRLVLALLNQAKYKPSRLKRLAGDSPNLQRFTEYLQRGWYDELWRTIPRHGIDLYKVTSAEQELPGNFSSAWNVAQTYYGIYNYVTALVFTNCPDLDTVRHQNSTKHFSNTLFKKFSGVLIKYPFNIRNPLTASMDELRGGHRQEWQYQYARSSRWSLSSPYDMETMFVELLGDDETLLHLMYKFRVWANYTGINSTLALDSPTYQIYLYKNLTAVVCFYALFSEVMAISLLGEDEFLSLYSRFLEATVGKNQAFRANHLYLPHCIRLRAYQLSGLISSLPSAFKVFSPDDPFDFCVGSGVQQATPGSRKPIK